MCCNSANATDVIESTKSQQDKQNSRKYDVKTGDSKISARDSRDKFFDNFMRQKEKLHEDGCSLNRDSAAVVQNDDDQTKVEGSIISRNSSTNGSMQESVNDANLQSLNEMEQKRQTKESGILSNTPPDSDKKRNEHSLSFSAGAQSTIAASTTVATSTSATCEVTTTKKLN